MSSSPSVVSARMTKHRLAVNRRRRPLAQQQLPARNRARHERINRAPLHLVGNLPRGNQHGQHSGHDANRRQRDIFDEYLQPLHAEHTERRRAQRQQQRQNQHHIQVLAAKRLQ
jgi:hypothetical protein